MTGHDYWDEQAAGYALDALEPEEAAEFVRHMSDCAECQALVDQHALVAAQLGALAYDDRPAPTWAEIRPGVIGAPDDKPGNVVPLRRRTFAVLAVAAAAAAVVVTAVLWPSSSSTHEISALRSVTACEHTSGCHVVHLAGAGGGAASVLVYRQAVTIYSDSMSRAPADSEWVLWQLRKNGSPVFLASYADPNGAQAALATPYADTTGFAISREAAGTTPTTPSVVVATGTIA